MWSRRVIPGWAFGSALLMAVMPGFAQVYVAMALAPGSLATLSEKVPPAMRAPVRQLDDEVQLIAPGGPVMLAQEFELRLEGETNALSRISVTQWAESPDGQWREVYQGFASGPGERRGDAVVVKVVPYQLGKVQLRVAGSGKAGEDLATLHKDVLVDVTAPLAGPVELRFGKVRRNAWENGGDPRMVTATLGLQGAGQPGQIDLSVEAVYAGVLQPQPVNPRSVQYRVVTGDQGAVISLDERTGLVRGLKAGHVLVQASSAGVTKQACVVVEDVGGSEAGPDCSDLVGR